MELLKKQLSEIQINQIITKCWESATFKQNLMANPVQTIQQETGCNLDLPAGVELVINDQSDARFAHFNIPAQPNFEDVELSEEELDLVSGGTNGNQIDL